MDTLTVPQAREILLHLQQTNKGFCFLQSSGQMVTREQCQKVLGIKTE